MKNRRSRKLIRPDIQVLGILFSLGLALVTLVVQSVTMTFVFHRVASKATEDGPAILQELPTALGWSALATFVVLGPVILGLTLHATHRYAGPIYRIEQYLKGILAGERPGPLRLRERDRLQDVAALLAEAMAKVSESSAEDSPAAEAPETPAEPMRKAG